MHNRTLNNKFEKGNFFQIVRNKLCFISTFGEENRLSQIPKLYNQF